MASPTTTPALSVSNLRKSYGKTLAVDSVSFEVMKGETLVLLGPSGCGKSSTLMAIAGIINADEGSIVVDGREITGLRAEQRNIGVVFQNYALFPHMTVLQNVMFPLRRRGWSRAASADRAREMLRTVRLSLDDSFPEQISGGQMQRVALARALVFDPPLLLMDEPLGALDRQLRIELQVEFRQLQERLETTALWVTHDQEEALLIADRLGVMRDGRFEQVGSAEDVYRRPSTSFVARFMGELNELDDSSDESAASSSSIVFLRPEEVRLLRSRAELGEGEAWRKGVVRDVQFFGDQYRVELEVEGASNPWSAKLSGASKHDHVVVGTELVVAWQESDLRQVPGETNP